jgi:hypothetical protein
VGFAGVLAAVSDMARGSSLEDAVFAEENDRFLRPA